MLSPSHSPACPLAARPLPEVAATATGEAAVVGRQVDGAVVLRSLVGGGFVPAFSTVGPVGICSFGGGFW